MACLLVVFEHLIALCTIFIGLDQELRHALLLSQIMSSYERTKQFIKNHDSLLILTCLMQTNCLVQFYLFLLSFIENKLYCFSVLMLQLCKLEKAFTISFEFA